jgi:hypothetical protein
VRATGSEGPISLQCGLVGAIWQVSDKLAFDVPLREARVNGHTVNELRAGVTSGLLLW